MRVNTEERIATDEAAFQATLSKHQRMAFVRASGSETLGLPWFGPCVTYGTIATQGTYAERELVVSIRVAGEFNERACTVEVDPDSVLSRLLDLFADPEWVPAREIDLDTIPGMSFCTERTEKGFGDAHFFSWEVERSAVPRLMQQLWSTDRGVAQGLYFAAIALLELSDDEDLIYAPIVDALREMETKDAGEVVVYAGAEIVPYIAWHAHQAKDPVLGRNQIRMITKWIKLRNAESHWDEEYRAEIDELVRAIEEAVKTP